MLICSCSCPPNCNGGKGGSVYYTALLLYDLVLVCVLCWRISLGIERKYAGSIYFGLVYFVHPCLVPLQCNKHFNDE